MDFRVVPIAEEHIAGFRAALDDVARERRYLIFLEAPSLEEVRAFVRHNIRKRHPAFVALAADEVIGWCDVLPLDRPTRAHTGTLGLAVTAAHRGRGVGTALLRETLEAARARGLTRIELGVRAANARVVPLYERFGFVREGVDRNAIRQDGEYEDLIRMAVLFD
jgi:RimJ/RimL family protein N-acetyltransferase